MKLVKESLNEVMRTKNAPIPGARLLYEIDLGELGIFPRDDEDMEEETSIETFLSVYEIPENTSIESDDSFIYIHPSFEDPSKPIKLCLVFSDYESGYGGYGPSGGGMEKQIFVGVEDPSQESVTQFFVEELKDEDYYSI